MKAVERTLNVVSGEDEGIAPEWVITVQNSGPVLLSGGRLWHRNRGQTAWWAMFVEREVKKGAPRRLFRGDMNKQLAAIKNFEEE